MGCRVEVDAEAVADDVEGRGVEDREASFEEDAEKSRLRNADAIVASGFERADEVVLCEGEVLVVADDDDALLAVDGLAWFFGFDEDDGSSAVE